ncbi:MAG TPA: SpoIIIAH-like family protein [Bacillota bacterium]|nr:SpoIIIAH-like family protein [Bacillota bacterium]HNT02672.1 SpoIIIAH-like family protein [Bacillota bacterium]HPA54205.1 SpoIIIAH-like family protein [Bacillota bacterium]HPX68688.1 SpoIIIAH-like family protein [Bacillota bacterium]HQA64706.1 SpoIIIAH-like family protein [Bacillota bacterium]
MQVKKKNLIICSMIILLFVVGYAYNSFTSERLTDANLDLDAQVIGTDEMGMPAETAGTEEAAGPIVIEDSGSEALETTAASFFSEYRIERDKNRSKEVEMWQDIINSDKAEENFKNMAQQEIVKIVSLTDKEMIIENLIISRGFNDALVFLTDDSATVIVEAKELTSSNIAQIQDIVVRKTKLDPKNIKIMKKN